MASPFQASLPQLDWNLLRTYIVIVEEKSLTRAADRLGLKQPTVSAALQRLEESLGCSLITRASRRFELTRHGELLYRECAQMNRSAVRIAEKLAGAERDLTGTVRIAAITDVRFAPFDQALQAMHRRFPSITVQIDIASSKDCVRAVGQKITPMALCLLPKPIPNLQCRYLTREVFGVFCGPGHALWGQTDVTLDALQEEAMVAFSSTTQGGILEPMLTLDAGTTGLGKRIVGSSTHLNEVLRMILAGMGIGILPVASVQREVQEGRLWQFDLPGIALGADLYLVTHPGLQMERAEAQFLSIFAALCSAAED